MWYRVGGCPPKPQWPHQERYLQQRHVALQGGLRDGESAGQVGIVDELADSGRQEREQPWHVGQPLNVCQVAHQRAFADLADTLNVNDGRILQPFQDALCCVAGNHAPE